MKEEIIDLVDENDIVIGTIPRSHVLPNDITNVRAINVFIKNSEGKLWIPRRTANKKYAPLALDMSAGGIVSSGESYEETFYRETLEELNLDINNFPWICLGKLTPKDGVKAFQMVYELKTDIIPDYNPDDFTEYYWLNPKEIIDRIDSGDKSKHDLSIIIKRFYL